MIKKIAGLIILALLLQVELSAQHLMHSYGSTISALFGTVTSPGSSSSFALTQTSLTYFPRYNFVEKDNSSVSVGIPVSIGIGITSSNGGNDAGIALAYDLPVALDYNIGFKSTNESDKNFGGYFGVGFGYYKVNISQSQYSDFKGASYGPMLRGGVRIGSSNESWNGHGLTIGMFYKKGLEKDKLTTIGFNVLYDL